MNEDGRRIGRIPGVEKHHMAFRPAEKILDPKVSMGPGGKSRDFLPGVEFRSSASAIGHMDRQYEGADADEMPSGRNQEATIFQASDLSETTGE